MNTHPTSGPAPPEVDAALEDIEGGEPNLLPVSVLDSPLEVVVPMWQNSMPTPEFPERIWLFWNELEVDEHEITAPVTEADRTFAVKGLHGVEGTHRLRYRVMTYNEAEVDSQERVLTVDRTPPALATGGSELVFPQLVVDHGVTAEYLEANSDKVVAGVPDYAPRPGDMISWYWDTSQNDDDLVDTLKLALADIGRPINLDFAGEMIRARGDGARRARYRVRDRAGNVSSFATYVTLEVQTSLRPRELAWPVVKQAVGSGELVTLEPLSATAGVTVLMPEGADIRPDDQEAWVQWGTPGGVGATRLPVAIHDDVRECIVPKEAVAAHIGKTLTVHYEIVDKRGNVHASQARSVKVSALPLPNLPTVQCVEAIGRPLSLASVPAAGAQLMLASWPMMTTDQRVRIRVDGAGPDGNPVAELVLDGHPVTEQELKDGLGKQGDVRIPRALLERLQLDRAFNVTVTVSFDAGGTWPKLHNFPRLSPMLVA
jgi:hypothetical protein